jgi:hypothetical protein
MNLILAGYVKYIELSHLVILWGLVYVVVCVAFKAVVMNFPILGGLFQDGHYEFCKADIVFRKLILWCSNNQTYHLDSLEILRFLGVVFQSFVVLVSHLVR